MFVFVDLFCCMGWVWGFGVLIVIGLWFFFVCFVGVFFCCVVGYVLFLGVCFGFLWGVIVFF